MDANGTRFHLLLGRDDWARRCTTASGTALGATFDASENGAETDFSWDKRRQELTLGNRVFYFAPSQGNRAVDLDGRRGAAADAYGNVYWIGEDGTEILVNSSGSRNTSRFWSSLDDVCPATDTLFAPAAPVTAAAIALSGMAVTTQHYLVVGTVASQGEPAGLLVFDLQSGGDPRQLLWPVAFAPWDMAPAADGGVWILDREHHAAWRLDRTMGVVPLGGTSVPAVGPTFQATDGSASHCMLPSAIVSGMALPLSAVDPVAIEALADDSILILDTPPAADFSIVFRVSRDGPVASASTDSAKSLVEESKRADFKLRGHDLVFVTKDEVNILYIAGSDGDQAVAFDVDLENEGLALHPQPDFFPMRLFGARGLISSADGPMYDAQDRWVPLVQQRRLRFTPESTLVIPLLDGKQPECVWHRLMLDACIPPECDVVVSSRASDDKERLELVEWQSEPSLLRRATGQELPWSSDTFGAGINTWELLFQKANGRYLQLRITLRGTGRSSPRLRALRVWYPRFSYLEQYLPAVYRENADSASFLDRFLANVEGFFTNIEDKVAAAQCLLDVRCAPPDALEWLASWFDVALDPAWDEQKRRLFLRHAAEFFEWRGTAPGMMMALRLVSEECVDDSIFQLEAPAFAGPRIVEKFRSRSLPGVLFGDTSDTTAGGLPLRIVRDKWQPSAGAADLHQRWAKAIARTGARYPLTPPTGDELAVWTSFSRETLGFVPRAGAADLDRWQQVLQRRYSSLLDLNRQWHTGYLHWSDVPLPSQVPETLAALRDWVHFEGLVLPALASAHRFSVFLPQGTLGVVDREKKLDLARRVVALEKPAHTTFDVKFYWAFFRVGEARLGTDTVVDLGSRSPELMSPFVLDRNYLGSGWLAPAQSGRSSSTCGCPPSLSGGSR
jgi:phage tail-like protein